MSKPFPAEEFKLFYDMHKTLMAEDYEVRCNLWELVKKSRYHLTKREYEQFKYRYNYGIGGKGNYSLEETGREFGCTRERIRQIEAKIFKKLEIKL